MILHLAIVAPFILPNLTDTDPGCIWPQLEPLVYIKPEDEFFHKHCSWSFTIATPKVA